MKEYAVIAFDSLHEATVIGIYEDEEKAESAVKEAWKVENKFGYGVYKEVRIFERWAA